MKEMLKKTWLKVIGAILLFLAGIFILGKCEKASAANFTLADGTISDIKYNENQTLEYNLFTMNRKLTINKNLNYYYFYLTSYNSNGYMSEIYFSYNCTRTDDTFTCEDDYTIKNNTSNMTTTGSPTQYTVYKEYIAVGTGSWASQYYPVKTYEQGYNDGVGESNASYEKGYQAGVDSVDITTDNQAYAEQYIYNNHYHSNQEYLEYGETKYQEGIDSVDIKSDNESAIQSYIAINNMKTETEYIIYGQEKYNAGITYADSRINEDSKSYESGKIDGINSVDITTDNQSYANQYIIDNNYKTYNEYFVYGEQQYVAGIKYANNTLFTDSVSYMTGYDTGVIDGVSSVDITTDNQSYADQYIIDNNYYTIDQVNVEKIRFYNMGQKNILYRINDYIFYNYDKNYNIEINCEDDECEQLAEKMSDDIHLYAYNSFNITDYITDNNYHTNDDYIQYGNTNYINGKYEGYNYLNDQVVEWLYNMNYEEAYINLLNNHVDMSETNINDYADGFEGINEVNKHTYYDTLEDIENVGYVQAMEDSEAFLGLIPTTLGAVVSNVMPILTYEVYGISLMNLIGLISIVGIAIIIVKFIVG